LLKELALRRGAHNYDGFLSVCIWPNNSSNMITTPKRMLLTSVQAQKYIRELMARRRMIRLEVVNAWPPVGILQTYRHPVSGRQGK